MGRLRKVAIGAGVLAVGGGLGLRSALSPAGSRKERAAARAAVALAPLDAVPSRAAQLAALRASAAGTAGAAAAPAAAEGSGALAARAATEAAESASPASGQRGPAPKVVPSGPAPDAFDVLVIGGGATGTGVALDAALRDLNVALVERDDFASGSSSRSTKLIHGGVRYLEKAFFQLDPSQLKLVFEALSERSIMLSQAPHLTRPLPTILPCYKLWEVPFYRAGLLVRLGGGRQPGGGGGGRAVACSVLCVGGGGQMRTGGQCRTSAPPAGGVGTVSGTPRSNLVDSRVGRLSVTPLAD